AFISFMPEEDRALFTGPDNIHNASLNITIDTGASLAAEDKYYDRIRNGIPSIFLHCSGLIVPI
ncbi:hypothetical protein M8375_26685, partial [Klebsiella pneumoniae]|nr:hypothetical protein [Klebsiella pneumoniae]